MGFFSRDKEEKRVEVQDLPSMPNVKLPELPPSTDKEERIEAQPLPKFPENSTGSSIGLQAIKTNVSFKPKFEEINNSDTTEKRTMEISDIPNFNKKSEPKPYSSDKEPIFIKLEKFKEAVQKFEEVKNKLKEIDESISKIREIKEREEQEIKDWGQEVQTIKEKVANIDSSLFNKI